MFSSTIDKSKGIAILLVVLGHINSPVGDVIYSFHIPLFFFIAGIFINTNNSGREFCHKGLKRLIIPYMIFGALGIIITYTKNSLLDRINNPISEALIGWLFWADYAHMQNYGFVLWFLPALFWGKLYVYVGIKYLKIKAAYMIVLSLIFACLASIYLKLPLGLDKGLVALPWLLMGYVSFQHYDRQILNSRFNLVIAGLVILTVINWFGIQRLDLANKAIGNPILTIPYTIGMTILIICLLYRYGKYMPEFISSILQNCGKNTMLIMVSHVYTNNFADVFVKKFFGVQLWHVTFIASISIVALLIRVKRNNESSLFFRYL